MLADGLATHLDWTNNGEKMSPAEWHQVRAGQTGQSQSSQRFN